MKDMLHSCFFIFFVLVSSCQRMESLDTENSLLITQNIVEPKIQVFFSDSKLYTCKSYMKKNGRFSKPRVTAIEKLTPPVSKSISAKIEQLYTLNSSYGKSKLGGISWTIKITESAKIKTIHCENYLPPLIEELFQEINGEIIKSSDRLLYSF